MRKVVDIEISAIDFTLVHIKFDDGERYFLQGPFHRTSPEYSALFNDFIKDFKSLVDIRKLMSK